MESFVPVPQDHHYPIQHLPYSAGHVRGSEEIHVLSRIGDFAIDLTLLERLGFFAPHPHYFDSSSLNKFMSQTRSVWTEIRLRLQTLLLLSNQELQDHPCRNEVLVPLNEVNLVIPVNIGDYTDFYCSRNHAYNVGVMFRGPENALQPNWTRMPIGYHGRSSSVVIEKDVVRPRGQVCPPGGEPSFSVCKKLDYELEIGFFVGGHLNELGTSIDITQANQHIFGIVLLNDWSARDIQAWEYVPLGPFNAKNFMTSISSWVVPIDALEPFKTSLGLQEPQPFPYLQDPDLSSYDISLMTYLQTPGSEKELISVSNLKHLYWSLTQQLAHHTVTGCNLRPGDLLGTGTISGTTEDSLGCLLEISVNGKKPLNLANGEQRSFLLDGDKLQLVAECKGNGFTIGFELGPTLVKPAIHDKYA
jgi:fumarylacetoacetase